MELQLDLKSLETALNESAVKALERVFSGYEIDRVLVGLIQKDVVEGMMAQAVTAAAAQVDLDELAAVLAKELARVVTGATIRLLREAVVDLVMKMRHGSDYLDPSAKIATRGKLLVELFEKE